MLRVVDLFAGGGGSSLGFQRAGFNVVAAYELWDKAVAVYRANFGHPVVQMDLADVSAAVTSIRGYNPDIIIGSSPCQEFSTAGKRVEGERAGLTVSFAEIIAAIKPMCFVMENVPQARKSQAYAEAREIFKAAGYGLTEVVINAALCGVPQRRKRFFCVGSLGDVDGFLSAIIAQSTGKHETTMREYFADSLGVEHYYFHQRSKIGVRRSIYSIDEPCATIRGATGSIPKKFVPHKGDSCELNPSIRPLTTLERAQVQTFPASFNWVGSKTDIEQMVGNAVPPKLAEAVAKALKQYIEGDKKPLHIGLFDAERWAKLHSSNPKTRNSSKFPNIALMKLSAWHKAQGNVVEWWEPGKTYDKIYASKVFEKTPVPLELPLGTFIGGTGFLTKSELPPEIDSIMCPDYSLYEDCDYAVGFTTRGCPNHCKWCCVPDKEGGIRPYASWRDIIRPDTPRLWLLDNNILACEHGIQQLREIADECDTYRSDKSKGTYIRLDLNQGMDVRLVTPEIADILSRITWDTRVRFSCDHMAQVPHIERVHGLLAERGKGADKIHIYFLVTADLQEAVRRIDALRNISPKLHIYGQAELNESRGIIPTKAQKRFADYTFFGDWANTHWADYCISRGVKDPFDPDMVMGKRGKAGVGDE